jgi:BirA family transcriptional regulator, biotin operon repressor / biotin---[acetyl-CoA-carboxylase] ligase
VTDFLARRERFAVVGSTNDVVRSWLAAGTPEVCLAVADEQSSGRGRDGRSWQAPPSAALLASLGFRPTWLSPDRTWRLAASVSMAMAVAGEVVADLPDGAIRLKWPNDLVVASGFGLRKLAGVLGESKGLGTDDPRVVIGIGVNGDWSAEAFPPDLAGSMTSLRALAADAPIDHAALLELFLERLEGEVGALRRGDFHAAAWRARQVTTGRDVELIDADGSVTTARAVDVDASTGALIVEDPDRPFGTRAVVVGEIGHVRISADARAAV